MYIDRERLWNGVTLNLDKILILKLTKLFIAISCVLHMLNLEEKALDHVSETVRSVDSGVCATRILST